MEDTLIEKKEKETQVNKKEKSKISFLIELQNGFSLGCEFEGKAYSFKRGEVYSFSEEMIEHFKANNYSFRKNFRKLAN